MRDPRRSVHYRRWDRVIDFLQQNGAADIDTVCHHLRMTRNEFFRARGTRYGDLACQDRGVTIPRPIKPEGYVYKLATGWDPASGGAAPNVQQSLSDTHTRLTTIRETMNVLTAMVGTSSPAFPFLTQAQQALNITLVSAEAAIHAIGGRVSARAA